MFRAMLGRMTYCGILSSLSDNPNLSMRSVYAHEQKVVYCMIANELEYDQHYARSRTYRDIRTQVLRPVQNSEIVPFELGG